MISDFIASDPGVLKESGVQEDHGLTLLVVPARDPALIEPVARHAKDIKKILETTPIFKAGDKFEMLARAHGLDAASVLRVAAGVLLADQRMKLHHMLQGLEYTGPEPNGLMFFTRTTMKTLNVDIPKKTRHDLRSWENNILIDPQRVREIIQTRTWPALDNVVNIIEDSIYGLFSDMLLLVNSHGDLISFVFCTTVRSKITPCQMIGIRSSIKHMDHKMTTKKLGDIMFAGRAVLAHHDGCDKAQISHPIGGMANRTAREGVLRLLSGKRSIVAESDWITAVLEGITILVPGFRSTGISFRPAHLTTRVQKLTLHRLQLTYPTRVRRTVGRKIDPIPIQSTIRKVGRFSFAHTLYKSKIRQSLISGRWRYCGCDM